MSLAEAVALGQYALMTALYIAGPVLMVALIVGTVVSVLQAVTQVQEMTLVFVPKILAAGIVLALAGSWMLRIAVSFGVSVFQTIPVH